MQNLFSSQRANRGTRVFPGLFQAQRGLEKNIERVTAYIQKHPMYLRDNHLLMRLLDSLPPRPSTNSLRHYDLVEDVADQIAHSVGITTSINPGTVFSGQFFGGEVLDIVLSGTLARPQFDANDKLQDWKNVSAATVLYHPFSDLNLNVPNGSTQSIESGYSVIVIDIPLLAIQFTAWADEQNLRPVDQRESTNQFVYHYVMGNMLKRQLQVSLFNRALREFFNEPHTKTTRRKPFAYPDYDSAWDNEIYKVFDWFLDERATMDDVIDTLPLRYETVLRDVLPFTTIVPTRQIYWALILAWLPVVHFMLHIWLTNQQGDDRRFIGRLKRELRRIRTDRIARVAPDRDLADLLEIELDTIESLL